MQAPPEMTRRVDTPTLATTPKHNKGAHAGAAVQSPLATTPKRSHRAVRVEADTGISSPKVKLGRIVERSSINARCAAS
jgi:hypothetical protein